MADMEAAKERDPACDKYTQCILYFKGFQAIQCQRIAHWLWKKGRKVCAACRLQLLPLPAVFLWSLCSNLLDCLFACSSIQRLSHQLVFCWVQMLAIALQSRVSEVLHVDIHPAAQLGSGVLIDHATGVVIGETAVVGNNVSMLHHVTLGGSGTGKGVRHPTIGACNPLFFHFHVG